MNTPRNTIAIAQVTLDGVMQSPGGPEENPRNIYLLAGWQLSRANMENRES